MRTLALAGLLLLATGSVRYSRSMASIPLSWPSCSSALPRPTRARATVSRR